MKTNGTLDRVLDSDMDSRRICFERGKAFVYMPGEDGDVIIAEEPNGVMEHRRIPDGMVTRTWPDGRVSSPWSRMGLSPGRDVDFPFSFMTAPQPSRQ